MKKVIALCFGLLMLLTCVACAGGAVKIDPTNPAQSARTWIEAQIKNNTLFSFDYDGVAYEDHIKKWDKTVEKEGNSWTVTYKNDAVTAWSEITLDEDTASVEWTNYFKNEGQSNSPVISNIQAIDSAVSVANPTFTTAEGSDVTKTDFQPIVVDLATEQTYTMKTKGGRSSQGAWPYFRIDNGEYGVSGGIGWTGDWQGTYTVQKDAVAITMGMQNTNIALYPDEQMRTPMIMLQFFAGDSDAGQNAFRQLILKNYTPKGDDGEPIKYAPTFISAQANYGAEKVMKTFQQAINGGVRGEGLWIDATWYGNLGSGAINDISWVDEVGNWYFIKDQYSENNILEVSNWLEENEYEFLLWVEPERVGFNTVLAKEYPQYYLKSERYNNWWLLDLGNDEACDFMTDFLSNLIKTNKVTWYRQDFNGFDPAGFWSDADKKMGDNRIGITEIKYVTNLYRMWDGMVEQNPGLMIDNCAAGGKRLDLEMMKRSVPLWRTDFGAATGSGSTPDNLRGINYNLTRWLPIHGGGYPWENSEGELYNWRCLLGSGGQYPGDKPITSATVQAFEENSICREMRCGDYYVLACGYDDDIQTADAAYEFYLPEEGRGYIIAFQPAEGKVEDVVYKLKGLDPEATYKLEVVDSGDTLERTGEQLMTDGIGLCYPGPAFSMLIYFNIVK